MPPKPQRGNPLLPHKHRSFKSCLLKTNTFFFQNTCLISNLNMPTWNDHSLPTKLKPNTKQHACTQRLNIIEHPGHRWTTLATSSCWRHKLPLNCNATVNYPVWEIERLSQQASIIIFMIITMTTSFILYTGLRSLTPPLVSKRLGNLTLALANSGTKGNPSVSTGPTVSQAQNPRPRNRNWLFWCLISLLHRYYPLATWKLFKNLEKPFQTCLCKQMHLLSKHLSENHLSIITKPYQSFFKNFDENITQAP